MELLVISQVRASTFHSFATSGNMWFSPSLPVVPPACQGHRAGLARLFDLMRLAARNSPRLAPDRSGAEMTACYLNSRSEFGSD